MELAEQLALPRRELLGHLENHLVDGIAVSASPQVWHALAVENGHVHLVTEAHLRIGEGEGADQIGAVALEDLVGANLDEDVEIAGGSAVESAFAFAGEAQLIPVRDPRGNGDGQHPRARHASFPAAGAARMAVDATRAAAGRTRTGDGEETLGETHLPLAAAGPAGLRRRPLLLARAATGLAALVARNLELGLQAPGRLFERDLESILEILTTPRAPASAAAPAAEEALEEIFEDGAEARVSRPAGTRDRAESVVLGALVGIREHGVGLADLLEALFGAGVSRVLVGVVLPGEGAVGPLQRGVVGIAGDAEERVVVFGRHATSRRLRLAAWPR